MYLRALAILFTIINAEKDAVFIMDRSEGITPTEFNKMLDFICSVVSNLNIGITETLVSVITYSESVTEEFDLKSHTSKQELLTAIKMVDLQIENAGSRETHKALKYVRENSFLESHGGRDDAKRSVILLTFGVSFVPFAIRESSSLKNLPADLFVVGIRDAATGGLEEMQAIASDPDSMHLLTLLSFDDLQNEVVGMSTKIESDQDVAELQTVHVYVDRVDPALAVLIVASTATGIVFIATFVYCVKRLHQRHRQSTNRNNNTGIRLEHTKALTVNELQFSKTNEIAHLHRSLQSIWSEQLSPISNKSGNSSTPRNTLLGKMKSNSSISPIPGRVIDLEYRDLQDVVTSIDTSSTELSSTDYSTSRSKDSCRSKSNRKITLPQNKANCKWHRKSTNVPWNDHFSSTQTCTSILSLSSVKTGTTALFQVY